MTKAEAEQFVEFWRARLCPEWKLELEDGAGGAEDALASTFISEDYLHATLYLHRTVDDLPDEEAKQTLLHELLHLVLKDFDRVARRSIRSLGTKAWSLANTALEGELERTVDRLADVLVDVQVQDTQMVAA